jgi:hypothetical protein
VGDEKTRRKNETNTNNAPKRNFNTHTKDKLLHTPIHNRGHWARASAFAGFRELWRLRGCCCFSCACALSPHAHSFWSPASKSVRVPNDLSVDAPICALASATKFWRTSAYGKKRST